ncbi:Vegetative incompatibility HET-E-1 [Fusarium acutatum]|uniref:Vegetative incompatibility HET-E-1 n=1 Tax=Fusarium acutatum TaxID=78861 RepID=A0A8H4JS61_9HYPO|nr:Vegetative incompatibility HET-E-1 [Fusarium acutatum]
MASPMDIDAQQSPFATSKRPRAYSEKSTGALQHEDYTIGWISALPLQMAAAEIILDHIHPPLPQHHQDGNTYTLGSIDEHNVVIACLPKDVRLGDVVVSTKVVQSDLGKLTPNDQFQRTSHPVRPPHSLMTAVSKLQASHTRGRNQMSTIIPGSVSQLTHFAHPNIPDRLLKSDYHHTVSGSCDSCDQSQLVSRPARPNTDPFIHYGRIASGNQVIKDTRIRDKISEELGVICFEMEAAGLMNSSPCLVVRGICDYSDSHKNKEWQAYAALVAAVYAKEVVMAIPFQTLQSWKRRRTQILPRPEPIDPEADECLREMFITDASLDREGILDAKGDICEGTCEWILSTDEFQTWDQNPPHLLWISAPPGMGKTFMSIYLSKHFEAVTKGSQSATLFFFCDKKIETRNTAVSILRGLMHQLISHQLISHQPNLVNTIMPQWKQQSKKLFEENSFGTLWKLFENAIAQSNLRTIYCVINALDECEGSSLSLLLRKFERMSRGHLGSAPKMKLVCLSRRYPENIPEALLLFTKIKLDTMSARRDDVRRYITFQVQELAQKKILSLEMRSRLEETFQGKSEGTFLWVSFMSQDLQKQRLLDFEESLQMLPVGLDAVYERILHTVELEKREMVRDILYWILVATKPLTIGELCEAVSMKPTRLLTRKEVCVELIKSCGHLLRITRYSVHWTVTFLHQSAKDYLMNFEPRFGSPISGLAHPQLHEHATIVLIRYLEDINCHKGNNNQILLNITKEFALAQYAVKEWDHHFRELEDISQVMRQGLSFFEKDSTVRRMWQYLCGRSITFNEPETVPLLHLSAFLGLNKLADWCLRNHGEHDIETRWGTWDTTALFVASQQEHEHILNLLLDAGANAVAKRGDGMTAVRDALFSGKRSILHLLAKTESCKKYLIEQAVNSRLIYDVFYEGNEEACRFLIEDAGWNLNWKNGEAGYSALTSAMNGGQFAIASYIIREWNVLHEYHPHMLKKTCSSYASVDDFEEIIRVLVDHCSVDINATDGEGHNALCATFKGRRSHALSSTRTLLKFGCSPDQSDWLGRTPVHCLVIRALLSYFPDFTNIMELLVCKS